MAPFLTILSKMPIEDRHWNSGKDRRNKDHNHSLHIFIELGPIMSKSGAAD